MKIPFEKEDRRKYYELLDKVFDSHFWSEGDMLLTFEQNFEKYITIPCVAVSNGGAGLLAVYEYINVKGKDVIVPANTFWATSAAAKRAGANIIYADCNKYDLCISYEDIKRKVTKNTKAVVVVHIGGHISFDIEQISSFCKERDIILIEDCAHAHGAKYKGKTPGSWGLAGVYSFYATKTMPVGEGGIVCSMDSKFIEWLKCYRNYGKEVQAGQVSYQIVNGFNFRMNEFTAALGIIQLERLPKILQWKRDLASKYDQVFKNRVFFPENMESGYYKYIVFGYNLREETGKVFNSTDFGHEIEKIQASVPNSYWIANHHRCVPIWYGWKNEHLEINELEQSLIH